MNLSSWGYERECLQRLLRKLRKMAGFTQAELAELLNKPQSYVSKYESGERRLDVIELIVVCKACKLTLNEFADYLENEFSKARGGKKT